MCFFESFVALPESRYCSGHLTILAQLSEQHAVSRAGFTPLLSMNEELILQLSTNIIFSSVLKCLRGRESYLLLFQEL